MKEKTKKLFSNIIGQDRAKRAITDWYYYEKQPLLIYGNSGYGKTKIAESLGAKTVDTTQMRGDRLNSILKPIKEAEDGDILFFDEIHSMPPSVLEGLYKIIDKGTFYDTELCVDLPLPKVRFVFATNILNPLPEAFLNRCRMIELMDYTKEELETIIKKAYPEIKEGTDTIVKAAKGVPRTALSIAKSIIAGAKTDKIKEIDQQEVNNILISRMDIHPETGLNSKEFLIIQKILERGSLSTSAVANLLKTTIKDAKEHYIDKLRSSDWLAVSGKGVIPGYRTHENYRLFIKRKEI